VLVQLLQHLFLCTESPEAGDCTSSLGSNSSASSFAHTAALLHHTAPKQRPDSICVSAVSGWRSVLEVLIVAAADSAAAVVNQALDALQPVIAALYADVGVGHQHFLGIVTAVAATMRSPYHAELSVSAVHVMQSVAQRLSQSDPQVSYRAAVGTAVV